GFLENLGHELIARTEASAAAPVGKRHDTFCRARYNQNATERSFAGRDLDFALVVHWIADHDLALSQKSRPDPLDFVLILIRRAYGIVRTRWRITRQRAWRQGKNAEKSSRRWYPYFHADRLVRRWKT